MSARVLPLRDFVHAADLEGLGIYFTEDDRWQARCGDVVLRCPETGLPSFSDLPRLLAHLAGAGIRCSHIEWDGLAPMACAQMEPSAAGDGEAGDSFPDAGALHPADTALFVAAALRGYVLSVVPDGYRLQRRGAGAQSAPEVLSFKQVANQCGATGSVTLRAAAERDGLVWPDSPEAFISLFKQL